MRIENRLKALEVVTKPERVLVAVGPDETLERAIDRMGLAPAREKDGYRDGRCCGATPNPLS